MSCGTSCAVNEKKVTCEVYCLHSRRLQQIAISCKRTYYNKLEKDELHQFSFHCHHEVLEEDGCHLWFWSFFSRFSVETVHYCDCYSEV